MPNMKPPKPREVHVFLHLAGEKWDAVLTLLQTLSTQEGQIMALLDDLTDQVKANTDAEASAIQLLQNLHDLLVAAGTDPTKLAALRDVLKTSQDALAAAIVANTPEQPPTP